MEVMVGLDAKFLYSETASTHMHTLKVAVFDMSKVAGGYSYDEITDLFERRLNRLPPFRRRAVPVPWGLGHPVWVEDPDFDLKRHITRRRAAEPGDDHALGCGGGRRGGAAIAARSSPVGDRRGRGIGQPSSRCRGEGASCGGRRSRHGCTVAERIERHGTISQVDEWHPESIPTRSQLLALAAQGHRTRLRQLPRLATRSVRGLREAEVRRRASPIKPPLPFDTPKTVFNVALTPERTYAMTTLALEDLKAVRRSRGATLNDVYLAMCGGALRAYLAEASALPDRPLVASVPVSTDPSVTRLGGNHLDNLYVSIGTDIADPLERLRHIHDVSAASKDARSVLGNDLLERRADVVPPQLYSLIVRTWGRTRLANHMRPPVNVVLSNVPGPRQQLHVGQATLEAIYSVGPILEGIGLNITAWSYADALHVSVLGSPTSVPDPWLIAAALHSALADLKRASAMAAASVPVDD